MTEIKRKETKWTSTKISEELEINYQTVVKRMKSKFADKRWGVQIEERPDGSIKRYVPEDKLHLWKEEFNYKGRPVYK